MLEHGLAECQKVLDLGTGSGHFINRPAKSHPGIEFIGVDKRSHLIDRGRTLSAPNVQWRLLDAENEEPQLGIEQIDGVLMRYFLLHIPNVRQVLANWKGRLKPNSRIWVIDVDLANFGCEQEHPDFRLLYDLVNKFCAIHSIDTRAGQKLGSVLNELGFREVISKSDPFSSRNMSTDHLVKFLSQETKLYAHLLGLDASNAELDRILRFINRDVAARTVQVDYGMVLWHARV